MTISTQKPSAAIVLAPLLLVLQATLSVEKVALLLYAVFVAVCYAAAIGFLWAWRSISGIIIALATGLHKTCRSFFIVLLFDLLYVKKLNMKVCDM